MNGSGFLGCLRPFKKALTPMDAAKVEDRLGQFNHPHFRDLGLFGLFSADVERAGPPGVGSDVPLQLFFARAYLRTAAASVSNRNGGRSPYANQWLRMHAETVILRMLCGEYPCLCGE